MTKKAVLINDLSGLGKCSLTAAISVLSVMGIQACPMPTAVLTSQTGFESFYCNDCTDKLDYYTSEWKNSAFSLTESIRVSSQVKSRWTKILSFIDSFETDNTLVLWIRFSVTRDLQSYTETLGKKMKKLVSVADVITPNLTECCILCDTDYSELIKNADSPDFLDTVCRACQKAFETLQGENRDCLQALSIKFPMRLQRLTILLQPMMRCFVSAVKDGRKLFGYR